MKGKILSVLVPTYNMENLLQNDLESLIVSEEVLSLLEVIVINDGSHDSSSDIAHRFERKYPGIFVVIDKKNGNYGSCINAGLKVAKGKYVKIMDSDDKFFTNSFEELVKALQSVDADLFFTDYVKAYTSGKVVDYTFDLPCRRLLKAEDVIGSQAFYDILMPALTYRTELLREKNYHQTEGISYTDMEWCFSPVLNVHTVYYLDVCVYRYLMGREGQTMDPAVAKRCMPQKIQCFSALLQRLKGLNLSPCMQKFATTQLVKHATAIYHFYLIENQQEDRNLLREVDSEMKMLAPQAYRRSGELAYRLHIPYHYVKAWRNGRKAIPCFIRIYAKIMDLLGTAHVKLFMNRNPNEVR